MLSVFGDNDLFGSGPHRFVLGTVGSDTVPASVALNDPLASGTIVRGGREREVLVRGRLVASSDAALNGLQQQILGEAAHPAPARKLRDDHDRSWPEMTLVRVDWGARRDRGRMVSIAYEAGFGRLAELG